VIEHDEDIVGGLSVWQVELVAIPDGDEATVILDWLGINPFMQFEVPLENNGRSLQLDEDELGSRFYADNLIALLQITALALEFLLRELPEANLLHFVLCQQTGKVNILSFYFRVVEVDQTVEDLIGVLKLHYDLFLD
jgi:hypothetical protein